MGTRIFERAAKVQPGQQHLKRVIAEMGGKDTVVVDEDADVELAANAIFTSAFGFSGQNVQLDLVLSSTRSCMTKSLSE